MRIYTRSRPLTPQFEAKDNVVILEWQHMNITLKNWEKNSFSIVVIARI